MRSSAWLCLSLAALLAVPAVAQDDEELAPVPVKKPAAKPKPKPKPAARPAPKKPVDEELAPVPVAQKGEVLVKTALTNAVLSIDGKEIGVLPQAAQPLPNGEHTVTVKRVGYSPFTKKVTIASGKTVEVEAKLTAVSAVLSVQSDVAGAQVFLDGKLIGTAPITDLEVPARPAEIVLRKEGYREEKQNVLLVAGRDSPLSMKLTKAVTPAATVAVAAKPEPTDRPVEAVLTPTRPEPVTTATTTTSETPIYGRWYFWAGAVAVAAVAVGAGFAINNSQPPRKLTANEICTPSKCDACIGVACFRGTPGFSW